MSQELLGAVFALAATMVGVFLAGGLTVLAASAIFIRNILASPVLIKALEGAFASLPADALDTLNLLSKLLGELTDKVPSDTKPPQSVPDGEPAKG